MGKKRKNSNYVTAKREQARIEKEREMRAKKRNMIIKAVSIPVVAVLLIVAIILGISYVVQWYNNPNKDFKVTHVATIKIKDYGTVRVNLYGEEAPISVSNFVELANKGFYNGLTFHRIMDGFMAQGGCPYGTGTGDSGKDIVGEFSANSIENNVKHVRGTISMARGDDPNSASSQFFIVHETSDKNTIALDGNYAAFGMVTRGMSVIDKMIRSSVKKGYTESVASKDQPIIESITIVEVN